MAMRVVPLWGAPAGGVRFGARAVDLKHEKRDDPWIALILDGDWPWSSP